MSMCRFQDFLQQEGGVLVACYTLRDAIAAGNGTAQLYISKQQLSARNCKSTKFFSDRNRPSPEFEYCKLRV